MQLAENVDSIFLDLVFVVACQRVVHLMYAPDEQKSLEVKCTQPPLSLVITAPHARTMIKCCHSLSFTASELSRCRPQFGPFQFLRIFCHIKVGARPCSLGLPSISLPTIFGTFWKVFSDKRTRVIATQMSGATGKGRNVKIELSRL